MVLSVAAARAQIAAQIVDGADSSITPSKLRQCMLDALDALNAVNTSVYAFQGAWNPGSGSFPGGGSAAVGAVWRASGSGTVDSVKFDAGDEIVAITANASTSTYAGNWLIVQGIITAADISDASANGRALITAANYAAMRTLLGLGSTKDARRNRIVNGGMQISQENGATSASTDAYYPVDQFAYYKSHDGTISVAQVASVTPGGSPNRLRATVSGIDTSIAAGQYAYISQRIEGQMVADFQYGGSSANAAILRFGVKAPAGTYCVSIGNSASNRSFVAEVVVSANEANSDVVKTVAIPGDTTGTWLTTTGIGLRLRWCLAGGSTYRGPTGWSAGDYLCTSNQSNFLGTNSQVFELFDVGLYLDADGTAIAPSWELLDYGDDLRRCHRYFYRSGPDATTAYLNFAMGFWGSTTQGIFVVQHPQVMRTPPTFSCSAAADFGMSSLTQDVPGVLVSRLSATSSGKTSGDGINLQAANTSTAWIQFNSRM